MHKIFLLLALSVIPLTATAQEPEQITIRNIAFIYEERARLPAAFDEIADFTFPEYRNAKNEFTKRELLIKYKNLIQSSLLSAKSQEYFTMIAGVEVKEYNFKDESFPLDFDGGPYVYGSGARIYALTFNNAKEITRIPMPTEKAKLLANEFGRTRIIRVRLHFKIVKAVIVKFNTPESMFDYVTPKTLESLIVKIEVLDKFHNIVSTITVPTENRINAN